MIAPYATEKITLELSDVEGNDIPVSEPFIDMTIKLMKKFGVEV
jgi:5-enolpyruvylshikimate-3-phosphate synthase